MVHLVCAPSALCLLVNLLAIAADPCAKAAGIRQTFEAAPQKLLARRQIEVLVSRHIEDSPAIPAYAGQLGQIVGLTEIAELKALH